MESEKKVVYVAGPLFNEMERERNSKIRKFLESLSFAVFLPQDDVGLSYDLIQNKEKIEIRKEIFLLDVKGVKESDIILFLMDGRIPDEGACIELGMGWMLGKPCVGYKTDNRAMDENGDDNIMIAGCLGFEMCRNMEQLKEVMLKFLHIDEV